MIAPGALRAVLQFSALVVLVAVLAAVGLAIDGCYTRAVIADDFADDFANIDGRFP